MNSQTGMQLDRLRLIALERIPRCGECPRFEALRAAYTIESISPETVLPPAPTWCTHRVCAPMARRIQATGRPTAA